MKENQNILSITFGCRLNTLESEKIKNMISSHFNSAIVINSCAVTSEAERQVLQKLRKIIQEYKNIPIFITGCSATLHPDRYKSFEQVFVIDNRNKLNLESYLNAFDNKFNIESKLFKNNSSNLSKKYIQIQNGCNHNCTFCITKLLRGKSYSFDYKKILIEVKKAVEDGFKEIVLTGIDIASYFDRENKLYLSDLCKKILIDVKKLERLRLSSLDPASIEISKIIELIKNDKRMMPHLHLSMQSGNDTILKLMKRRHNTEIVKKIMSNKFISFSWDIICGFPQESEEFFNDTLNLVKEIKPIHIHAFPFSPREYTESFDMPNQIQRSVSKYRVKLINNMANLNKLEFMKSKIGTISSVLVEENNIGKTEDEIPVKILDNKEPSKSIVNVKLIDISDLHFIGKIC